MKIKKNSYLAILIALMLFVFSTPFWIRNRDRKIYKELNKHATEIVIDTTNMSILGVFYGVLYDKDSTVICEFRFRTGSRIVDVKYDDGKFLGHGPFNDDMKLYDAVVKYNGLDKHHHATSKKDFYKKLK